VVILLALIHLRSRPKRSSVVDTFSGKVDSKGLPARVGTAGEIPGRRTLRWIRRRGTIFIASQRKYLLDSLQVCGHRRREYPILTWRWKVTRLPKGRRLCAGRKRMIRQVSSMCSSRRFPEQVRSQIWLYLGLHSPQGPYSKVPPTIHLLPRSWYCRAGRKKWPMGHKKKAQTCIRTMGSFGEEIPPRAKRISL